MSHSFDETYDVYDERQTVARKSHTCDACKEPVLWGHTYWRIGILFDGSWETVKRCQRCQAIHQHLRHITDPYGDTWPEETLNCGLSYEEEWGPLPEEIAALAFALPGDAVTKRSG